MKSLLIYHDRMNLYAILLLVVALLIFYFIGNRRFNRRGIAGTQYFKSYWQSLITTSVERLVNSIAVLMVIAAIVLFITD